MGDAASCVRCAEAVCAGPPREGALLRVLKAFAFGSGVGLAGDIGFGLISTFLEVELALVTSFIGWMVGRAVRSGSEGRGGRGYQVMGAVLTYGWCMMASVPALVMEQRMAAEPAPFPVAVFLSPFLALVVPFTGAMGVLNTLILAFGVWRGWRERARLGSGPVSGRSSASPRRLRLGCRAAPVVGAGAPREAPGR
ncbi:MAG: hypothetical protein INH41_00195 [Myxococcaceae bacterium]|nr:hypothetical protein [Myxococcaceae bacterium]